MNILIATSEAVPLAKTGGLADVCGALPKALAALGHNVALILPAYRCTKRFPSEPTNVTFSVNIRGTEFLGTYRKCTIPEIGVPVYLVEHDWFYDRDGLYNEKIQDYGDNCERFVFFSYAVMEAIRLLQLPVDILHVNDWQTGLIPALLALSYRDMPGYERISSLMTIHNIAYQGSFPASAMSATGLHWKYFNWLQMEFYDRLNLLKTGLVFADGLTTVSPQYANEIKWSSGFGLESVLRNRADVLWGVTNGIDTDEWNPETDPLIPQNYTVRNFVSGKRACKMALQEEFGLDVRADVPMVGMVGRLTEQKGFDLAIELMYRKLAEEDDIQWVLLGTGDPQLEKQLRELAEKYPNRVAAKLQYSNAMSHRIIAASDLFLMPSRFEPCGLTQMYSMRYGTIPVAHATGGLIDTITDMNDVNLENQTATGVLFQNMDIDGIRWGVEHALGNLRFNTIGWRRVVRAAMRRNFSWQLSAEKYVEIYEKIRRKYPRQ